MKNCKEPQSWDDVLGTSHMAGFSHMTELITKLRSENKAMKEALKKIASSDDNFGNWKGACQFRQRIARSALKAGK